MTFYGVGYQLHRRKALHSFVLNPVGILVFAGTTAECLSWLSVRKQVAWPGVRPGWRVANDGEL